MSTEVLTDKGRVRDLEEWQTVELFASAARTKATDPATTTGSAVYIGDWTKLQVIHDVTALATDVTTDTLTVTVDMSMDNLAWYSVGQFTVHEGNGSASREIMTFVPGGRAEDPNAIVIGSTDAATTVIRQHLVGRWIRYTLAVADNASDASFTSSLMVSIWRDDIVRVQENEIKEVTLVPLAIYSANLTGATWEIGNNWDWMQLVLRTTNHDTATADKGDFYVDLSVDGVLWVNVASFTQADGDDGPWVELATLVPGLPDDVDADVMVTSAAAETVVRPGIVGAFLRGRVVITSDTTPLFTASLKAYIK